MNRTLLLLLLTLLLAACGAPQASPESDILVPEHIEFEDRMAIRARLTMIRTEAREEAGRSHDRFASKEEAIAYEELATHLEAEKRDALKREYDLNDPQLDAIVEEYLRKQGVNLHE